MPHRSRRHEPSSSESEDTSNSLDSSSSSEEEIKRSSKRRKSASPTVSRKKTKKPKEAKEESSEGSEQAEHSVDDLKKLAEKEFERLFAKYSKKSSGKEKSELPKNTNLYLEVRNDISKNIQHELLVTGRDRTVANERALQGALKLLQDMKYSAELRVPLLRAKK